MFLKQIVEIQIFILFFSQSLTLKITAQYCKQICFKKRILSLENQIDCIQSCLKKFRHSEKFSSFQNQIKQLPNNFCLSEQNPTTNKENLLQFAQGPCSPIMLVPGFLSTKLVIEIQCEVFQKNYPEIFKVCGWDSCNNDPLKIWLKTPKKEYILWIPELLSPMSIVSLLKSNMCFSLLFKPEIDFSQKKENIFFEKKGIKIKIFGFSENTKNLNQCGQESIQNLLPYCIQTSTSEVFKKLADQLKRIGYISGLTFQAMPYNFYYGLYQNEFNLNFIPNLKRLNKLTGKKTIIVAHSFGNLTTLYNLNKMNLEDKKKYIKNWVAVAPPFLGAYRTQKIILGGNEEFIKAFGYVGFHYNASVAFTYYNGTSYHLLAKDFYELFKNEKWFDKILQRIKYENNDIPFDQSGIPFWPKKEEICHDENLPFQKECLFKLENSSEDFLYFKNDSYKISNFYSSIQKYIKDPNVKILHNILSTDELTQITPQIPVLVVFQSINKTSHKFYFSSKYEEQVEKDIYPELEKVESIQGDSSVPLSSSVVLPLKWALNAEENKENFEKVGFIEICSNLYNSKPIYDSVNENGKFFNQNFYKGIECECKGKGEDYHKNNCKHNGLIQDNFFIQFMSEVLNTNEKANQESIKEIEKFKEEDLINDIKNCRHIENNVLKEKEHFGVKEF